MMPRRIEIVIEHLSVQGLPPLSEQQFVAALEHDLARLIATRGAWLGADSLEMGRRAPLTIGSGAAGAEALAASAAAAIVSRIGNDRQ